METDNTGMRTPPTDPTWPPPPPSPTFLSANAATFVPTSSLLGQARGVLYSQTPMKAQYYQYIPHTHEQNNSYTLMPVGVNLSQSQSMDYQQQTMCNPLHTTTIITTNSAIKPTERTTTTCGSSEDSSV